MRSRARTRAGPPAGPVPTAALGLLLAAASFAAAPAPAALTAQKLPIRVHGVVMDSALDRPLPGVLVVLDTGERVRADDRGRFSFPAVAPGLHQLMILGVGCRASVASFDAGIDPDRPVRVVVGATFGAPEPADASAQPPRNSPGRVVTAAEIREMGAASLVEVLRRVAPYMVTSAGGQVGAGTRLRGRGGRTIADERVPLVSVDGVVLFSEDPTLLDAIPVKDVAWLEILPGAIGGWSFGTGATGGVLRIRTHRGSGLASEADPGDCLMAATAPTGPTAPGSRRPGPAADRPR